MTDIWNADDSILPPRYSETVKIPVDAFPSSLTGPRPWYMALYENLLFKNLFYIVIGLALGTAVDKTVAQIKAKDPADEKKTAWIRMFLQLAINVVVIYMIETFVPRIADDMINTNAGMFFPAMFFSVQTRFFQDWEAQVNKV